MFRLHKNFATDLSLLVTAAVCVFFGKTNMLYTVFAIVMHELAHYIGALISGISPESLIVHGFGVEMRFNGTENGGGVMLTALCGPLMSMLLAVVGYKLKNFEFFASNAAISAINFLPAVPLDGGQVLYCFLSGYLPRRKCRTVMKVLGLTIGGLISILGLYVLCISGFNFSLLFIGVFIIISNTGQMYNPVVEITKQKTKDCTRCNVFVVDENEPAVKTANMLPSNALGAVKTEDGRIKGFVTPGFLYRCAEKHGSDMTTEKVLSCYTNHS